MIIDQSYFTGEFLIAGISGQSSASFSGRSELDWFINRYEPEFLKLFLGAEFATAFIDDCESDDPEFETLKDLIYDSEKSLSPVAGYVYYHFMRNQNTQTAQLNQVRTVSENAGNYNAFEKMADAWNYMVDMCVEIWDHLTENYTDYPLFDKTREFPYIKINTFNF